MSAKNKRGIICALAGGCCWGFSATVGQYLFTVKNVDSLWLTIVRMIFAGLILIIIAGIKDPKSMKEIWKTKKDIKRLFVFSIFGLMLCQYTYLTAIYHSNAGTATVLQYLGQAFILIYVCVCARRLPAKKEVLALFFALAGVFLLVTHGDIGGLAISKQTLFWGIGAALGLMLYTILPGDLTKKYNSIVCVGYGMIIGGITLFLLGKGWNLSVALDLETIMITGIVVLVGTAMAFTLYIQSVSDLGGVKASLLACCEPVSAMIVTSIWMKTKFTVEDIIALFLIIGMVLLISMPDKDRLLKNSEKVPIAHKL